MREVVQLNEQYGAVIFYSPDLQNCTFSIYQKKRLFGYEFKSGGSINFSGNPVITVNPERTNAFQNYKVYFIDPNTVKQCEWLENGEHKTMQFNGNSPEIIISSSDNHYKFIDKRGVDILPINII